MISRIKILGRLNVAEKRKPQDGRLKTRTPKGQETELRLSTLPTAFGEKLVMRIFDPDVLVRSFQQLGFDQSLLQQWQRITQNSHGIILVTGPTGSGKTTTLYSSLKQLDIQSCILSKTYKMQLAQYYPTLNASLSYSWIAMAEDFKFKDYKWNPYSVGGLSLTVPIFSGGQRWYNLKQTKVQQEELDLQRENTRRNLVVAVKQGLSSLETAVKQYNAAQASIEGAKTGYEIAQKRYEIGSGTLLEMNDAQLALLQAKLNLNQSIYTYLVAKSSLDKVLGVNVNDETEYNPQKRELIKKLPVAKMEHSKAADDKSEGDK